jgi:hypothetical protein
VGNLCCCWLQTVLSDLVRAIPYPEVSGKALEYEGLDDALGMWLHQAVVNRRRTGCEVCAKNYEVGDLLWENMKEPGHTCAADLTPIKLCDIAEVTLAEEDVVNKRWAEAFLLVNEQASAKQIVELGIKEHFETNRMCFTDDVNDRLTTHRTYECDPFGRKIETTVSF